MVMFPSPAAAAVLVLVVLELWSAEAQVAVGSGPPAGCPDRCGNVTVPFPFGIRDGCSLEGFGLTCNNATNPPLLMVGNSTLQVVSISPADSTVRALDLAGAVNITQDGNVSGNGTWGGVAAAGPYVVSEVRNQLVVTGCNIQVTLMGNSGNGITGCSSFCPINDMYTDGVFRSPDNKCSGIGCCQTPISIGRPSYSVKLTIMDNEYRGKVPEAIRIAELGWFDGLADKLLSTTTSTSLLTPVPVVLEWAVASTVLRVVLDAELNKQAANNWSCPTPGEARRSACLSSNSYCRNVTGNYRRGYVCQCQRGYDGNPYVAGGCQDINECERAEEHGCYGECINTPGAFVCRRARILRQKFFKQNRGHLLQQLVSQKADIAERMIIPLAELEKATNNFDESRELGGGGHGTVYKGILSDHHVVAIKKSNVAVQREIDEFINEVAILSQINHRNVVKLFGCCLETEVPLLVYEFISNGTLYHHLHVEGPTSLPWEDRLRIATETARSLAYLHSAVSFPIIHRDIKSHNILLDDSLTTKVSDFGASRCIPAEQTAVTTAIQGTLGYLDPMYYYTGRLTEKSDIYSFGVVLIELLTRKKPYSYRSPEDETLVAHFTTLLSQGNLGSILDLQVMEEGNKEVNEVALLAVACVKLKAEERPTMRQVEMTLESIRSSSLQQELPHSVSTKKSEENHVSWRHTISEGTSLESTRQYSLEEEYLLSSRKLVLSRYIDECKLAGKCFGDCTNTPGDYECRCPRGARGDPRIPNGCVKTNLGLSVGIGVGSGAGLLVMGLGAAFLIRKVKKQRARMLRQKFFKQNRGHLLQQLVSQKADIAERMIIPLPELEKATNNFDKSRELGGGGHGTVYKGILSDLHVVAIKKSKEAVQREIDEFINEVAILSQINHRNVVKLFGCCLETEVPLLVYEFISNGTLYHHLHVEGPTSLPWEARLRIATETARALAYLHSAVSFPIIHRDIKSHNILLDGSLTTKVSDFGASRCIPAEQTGITTAVQGTLGYLDPMYYYTGRLTEKSDVFSFGVVLIELLTRKKPYAYRSSDDESLVAHFTTLLTQGNLGDILDPQVKEEGGEEVKEVAVLAVACVKLKAEERPTMRQVEMTLESVRSSSLQQEVLHGVGAKKPKENHVSWSYPVSEGTSIQSTRQYSLEEEYLLSSSAEEHELVVRGDDEGLDGEKLGLGGGVGKKVTRISRRRRSWVVALVWSAT
uniref:Protein kinase domain-containing protein n=1 Tax=Oryza punctata TaxID=4537 RepID=A0A0E0M4K4_ORYPU